MVHGWPRSLLCGATLWCAPLAMNGPRQPTVRLAADDALQGLQASLVEVGGRIERATAMLELPRHLASASDLEAQSASGDFWNDAEAAEATLRRLAEHRAVLEQVTKIRTYLTDSEPAV